MSDFGGELDGMVEDCQEILSGDVVVTVAQAGSTFDASTGVSGAGREESAGVRAVKSAPRAGAGPGTSTVMEVEYAVKAADLAFAPKTGCTVMEEGDSEAIPVTQVEPSCQGRVWVLRCRYTKRVS